MPRRNSSAHGSRATWPCPPSPSSDFLVGGVRPAFRPRIVITEGENHRHLCGWLIDGALNVRNPVRNPTPTIRLRWLDVARIQCGNCGGVHGRAADVRRCYATVAPSADAPSLFEPPSYGDDDVDAFDPEASELVTAPSSPVHRSPEARSAADSRRPERRAAELAGPD